MKKIRRIVDIVLLLKNEGGLRNEGGLKKIFEVEKAENSRIIAGMVYIRRRLLYLTPLTA